MFTSQEIIGDIVYISFSDPERYVDIGIKAESSHFKVLGYDNIGIWVEHPSLLVFKDSKSKNKEIKVEGPNEKLDFTYIDDLVDGLILAASKKKAINQTFNITYGKGRKLIEFVNILKKYYPNLKVQIRPKDKSKPSRGTLSIKKAKKRKPTNTEKNMNLAAISGL